LKGIKDLLKDNPDATEALMKKHLLPFTVVDLDEEGERPFLLCGFNTVGGKHRSPWTNNLYPKQEGAEPQEADDLRLFEEKVNAVWDAYKDLYYGPEAVGSVYLHDSDKYACEGLFGICKKSPAGSWNSIHIVHVDEPDEKTCHYRVESTVLLILEPQTSSNNEATNIDISASLSKETSKVCKISRTMLAASHIENMGTLIEANEIDLRSNLERVSIPKLQEVMDGIQKQEEKKLHAVNPLMGMIMESSVLKKKLANEQAKKQANGKN
jgi:capping protein beta